MHISKSIFIIVSFFLVPFFVLSQQSASFRYLSKIDGLSQSSVFAIAQDSVGFMWFGTRDGLNKFDGNQFKVFKHSDSPNSIVANDIRTLYLDPLTEKLWIGTTEGLSVYDPDSDTFSSFRHQPDDNRSLSNNEIRTIFRDDKERLWVASAMGLHLFRDRDNTFQRIYFNQAEETGQYLADVKAILQDKNGTIWFGAANGLFKLKEEKDSLKFIRIDEKSGFQIGDFHVKGLLEDVLGNLWIGTLERGMYYWDRSNGFTKQFKSNENDPFALSHNNIRSMCQDKEGNLWIATFDGLNFLKVGSSQFQHFPTKTTTASGLSDKSIRSVFIDKRGSLWVGTYYGGINHLDEQYNRFDNYQYSPLGNSISASVVSSFAENSNGDLWIGTEGGGLNYWDRDKKQFKSFKYQEDQRQSLSGNNVKTILLDDHKIWVGTFQEGLNLFDPQTEQFTVFKHQPEIANSLSNNNVYALLKRKEKLWIITYGGGLNIYDTIEKQFTHYRHSSLSSSLSDDLTRVILQTKNGDIWIGTEKGINKVDLDDNGLPLRFTTFLPDQMIYVMHEDPKGFLWIGTFSQGLFRLDPNTGDLLHFTKEDGLPGNTIFGILEVSSSEFWLSTNNGLSKFNPVQSTFTNFNYSNGLENSEFNFNAYYQTRKGELLFGGVNGFTLFDPTKIKPNRYVPPLAITDLYQNNKLVDKGDENNVLSKSINTTDRIQFAYNEANFSLHFAALDYFSPENNRYAFKLEGIDRDWNYATGKAEATYTIQREGEYIFRLKGGNSDGVWNPSERQLTIEVLPPPWRTWWAYLLYITMIGMIVYGLVRFIRLRHRLQLEQIAKRQQEELLEVKLRFFTNITHEFRTPLTLILGPIRDLLASDNHPDKVVQPLSLIQKNAQRLLNLVNQVLTFRKLATDHEPMNITHGNIVAFLEEIFLPFQEIAKSRNIKYQFKATSKEIMLGFDQDKLEKVFFNLLSNAFKFTPDQGHILLTVSDIGQNIEVRVEDDGIGVEPAYQEQIFKRFYEKSDAAHSTIKGTGIGLAISKQMVELHQGKIFVEQNPEQKAFKGATFVVQFPNEKTYPKEVVNMHKATEKETIVNDYSLVVPSQKDQRVLDFREKTLPKDTPLLLIVEDNPEVRAYIQQIFTGDYQIITAGNGQEGLEKAKKELPHLIISDVMMPKMDGITFCNKLKTDLEISHIPVILLTARTAALFKIEGLKTGADDYVTKPFDPEELRLRVRNIIKSRQEARDKFARVLTFDPKEISITSADEVFLENALRIVEEQMENYDFNVNQFAFDLAVSRPLLFTKLKALTGQTPNNFIKTIRLKRAAQLLETKKLNVSEVAHKVGFKDPKYFRKCFKEQFNITPSAFEAREVD